MMSVLPVNLISRSQASAWERHFPPPSFAWGQPEITDKPLRIYTISFAERGPGRQTVVSGQPIMSLELSQNQEKVGRVGVPPVILGRP